MMNIFLIRHGDAESVKIGMSDGERKLTPEGEALLYKAAEGWTKLIPSIDYIVSSPLIRAVQTAQIIKKVFQCNNEILIDKAVISDKTQLILELANALHGTNIAFCGHEPSFSRYLAEMIANSGDNLVFKKGMIAKVSFEGKVRVGAGCLEFLIPAKAYK